MNGASPELRSDESNEGKATGVDAELGRYGGELFKRPGLAPAALEALVGWPCARSQKTPPGYAAPNRSAYSSANKDFPTRFLRSCPGAIRQLHDHADFPRGLRDVPEQIRERLAHRVERVCFQYTIEDYGPMQDAPLLLGDGFELLEREAGMSMVRRCTRYGFHLRGRA